MVLIYPYLGGLYLNPWLVSAGRTCAGINRNDIHSFISMWCANNPCWQDFRFAPLVHTDMTAIAPCIVIPAEYGPLQDDILRYVEKLTQAGVNAWKIVETGLIHGYLRARHCSTKGVDSFTRVCGAICELAKFGPYQ